MADFIFFYAVMGAGKSSSLVEKYCFLTKKKLRAGVFIPKITNSNPTIRTRAGFTIDVNPFDTNFDFEKHVQNLEYVFVDEAQFLTKEQVIQLWHINVKLNKHVYCYGLKSNVLPQLFEGSAHLIIYADKLIALETPCFCGQIANFHIKIQANTPLIFIPKEAYKSLCKYHYLQIKENNI